MPLGALICLLPQISSGIALFLGVAIALTLGNPYLTSSKKLTTYLLQISVVGLGAGMNLNIVASVGLKGIGYTVIGIVLILALGFALGKFLKTERDTSILITVGTAICGGSAIAAVAPALRAKSQDVTVALGVVFILNSVALFIFPPLGHHFALSQHQFGLWSALAIHDTSSVVGASLAYGAEAMQTATTVKLARALWIVPVSLGIGWLAARTRNIDERGEVKAKKPWFILGFLIAAALVTYVPTLAPAGEVVNLIAKRLLVVTLFLIGASLTRETVKQVGPKPLIQGVALWIIAASATLLALKLDWIA
ncbi:MAG: putative sulfate exporter family transporter [Proteobacteria bacterium]|nr:MAG: putative sulfate exporter family transporter [Pseudomonadota bacterium]